MADKILYGRSAGFFPTFERRPGPIKTNMHYCPGCGHGILHKLIAEAIQDFGIKDKTIIIAPVGCAVFSYYYFDCFGISVPHGRAPAVGTGLARANQENIVISYQGDGDAYNIGIGYLGTNTPIDHCFVCGFQGDFEPTEEGFKCPECGNSNPDKCNVTKRTCGYLGSPVQRPMVHGRHEEIAHRVKHMSGETGRVTLDDGTTREWFEETK